MIWIGYAECKGVNAHSEIALYASAYREVDVQVLQYRNAVEHSASLCWSQRLNRGTEDVFHCAEPEGNVIETVSWDKPYEEKDL